MNGLSGSYARPASTTFWLYSLISKAMRQPAVDLGAFFAVTPKVSVPDGVILLK
jgi:hypothetical protein